VVVLAEDGAVRAMVGGQDYWKSPFNRAASAYRQPGSAFKPFVFLTALESGLTPDTIRQDAPVNVRGWKPENYSRDYFGNVSLTQALALSLNTVAVRVGQEVGPRAVVKTAHRLGVGSELKANATIALGTSEVTPLELVTAYAPFANGGIGVQPHAITRVRTADGKLLYQRRGSSNGRLIEPQYVAMMNAMMEETLLTGTAKKAALPGWQAAGKTGTSQDFRDAWFVGYTGNFTMAVWYGNDDYSSTNRMTGGSLPAQTWHDIMVVAHQGVEIRDIPGIGGGKRLPQAEASASAALKAAEVNPGPPPILTRRGASILVRIEKLFDEAAKTAAPGKVSNDMHKLAPAAAVAFPDSFASATRETQNPAPPRKN